MVINDLNIFRSIGCPAKADAKLVIDPNAPLPLPVTYQHFRLVTHWHAHVVKQSCKIKLYELSQCLPFNLGKALACLKPE